MTKYAYPTVLLVPSGSMHTPAVEINYDYNCPDGGMDGHGIQSPLYLDPRNGNTFVYCPIHKVIFRISDNVRIKLKNASWEAPNRDRGFRIPTKSGGTKRVHGLSWSTLDVE